MKKLFTLALLALALAAAGRAAETKRKSGERKSTMVSAAELPWEPYAPGSPLQVAPLWGNRDKGAHGMLLKLPAGFEAGLHSHTATYQAVLVQGKWVHSDAKASMELGPTSYVKQPGKSNHNDVCKGPEDCIIFIYQSKAGDFIPAAAK